MTTRKTIKEMEIELMVLRSAARDKETQAKNKPPVPPVTACNRCGTYCFGDCRS